MEFNDFNVQANNYNTYAPRFSFSGVAIKSLMGLLLIAVIVCGYLFTGFSLLRTLPTFVALLFLFGLTFLQNFFSKKVETSENKLGFWLGAVICQGIFIAEFVNQLIMIMAIQSNDILATIGSLPAILFLAVGGTFALAIAGILTLPYLLKRAEKTLSFLNVFMRLATTFLIIMAVISLVGVLFSLFGGNFVSNFVFEMFYGANFLSIAIAVIYLLISCGMFVMSLMAIALLKDQGKSEEWYASLLIVEIISLMFYYLFNILIQIFASSDND